MNDEVIGAALIQLSDIANCVSGDLHTLHLNVQGIEFDNLHKKVLKKYYEQASDDYDALSESARMFYVPVPSTNESSKRLEYQSVEGAYQTRIDVVSITEELLVTLLEAYHKVFLLLNKKEDDYRCIGVTNFLQTRIEYWAKEKCFFNHNRREAI